VRSAHCQVRAPGVESGPSPYEAIIIKQIQNGGSSLLTKAHAAKLTTQMVGYESVLTPTQINDVAAYLYTSTHKTK
jgi:hypothetical protein